MTTSAPGTPTSAQGTMGGPTSPGIYSQLEHNNIRVLELTRGHEKDIPFVGRLKTISRFEGQDYVALSYVWGERTCTDPTLLVDGHPLQIGASLWQALEELMTDADCIRLWVDQICINQDDEIEKEQQVQLMSKIYRYARRVIGWLGGHDKNSHLTFALLYSLGWRRPPSKYDREIELEWRRAIRDFANRGLPKSEHVRSIEYRTSQEVGLFQAAACLAQRPFFHRLWIVQEITLATTLVFRCGSSSIKSDVFFNAISGLCYVLVDPPVPLIQNHHRTVLKLAHLRRHVSEGRKHSFPHLAQTLSLWNCGRTHDRLIALLGIAFRDTQAWFTPSYRISGPELYVKFAEEHISTTKGLNILHFAGYEYTAAHTTPQSADQLATDNLQSWVPDWRVQSRPSSLSADSEDASVFSATDSEPEFERKDRTLQVRAREMDKIEACGSPCNEELYTENLEDWLALAKPSSQKVYIDDMMLMRAALEMKEVHDFYSSYNLQEIYLHRTFFITEAGRLGLGSNHVSPGDSIYLIHGLKTPFAVTHREPGMHVLRGECYVHGLMVGKVQHSDQDSFLNLI